MLIQSIIEPASGKVSVSYFGTTRLSPIAQEHTVNYMKTYYQTAKGNWIYTGTPQTKAPLSKAKEQTQLYMIK